MVEGYEDQDALEKKRKKKIEQRLQDEQRKKMEVQAHLAKSKLDLHDLQDLVQEGEISLEDKNILEKISQDKKLDQKEMGQVVENVELKDLLEKMEEIEKTLEENDMIPKELRVKKDDFIAAIKDPTKRQEVLQKIDDGIDCVMTNLSGPTFKTGGNPFARRVKNLANLLFLTNKKTIAIQEHMIDLKRYLTSKSHK